MSKKHKKMIAPVIIVIIIVFLCVMALFKLTTNGSDYATIILTCIPIIGVIIGVVVELWIRIREIKGGEEDDLSNY